jgi:glutamate racemase
MSASTAARPVGIFDSGVGGLSVWNEIRRRLPGERFVYFADTARCPYGGRPQEDIHRFAQEIVRFLLAQRSKLIVVASNTITAGAIDRLRKHFEVPFVGVEPAIKSAVARTKTGHIGVLATEFTLASERYKRLVDLYAASVRVHYQTGYGLVEIVEEGLEDSPKADRLLRRYLKDMKASRVDQLILGCTHYPFLRRQILRIMGEGIAIHDPAEAVARRAEEVLKDRKLLHSGKAGETSHLFFTTAGPERLRNRVDSLVSGGRWVERTISGGRHRLDLCEFV